MQHLFYGGNAFVSGADEGDEAFPGLLPDNSQSPELTKRRPNMVVLAYFTADSLQVMVKAEVMFDESVVNVLELQLRISLAHF